LSLRDTTEETSGPVTPRRIMELATGYWASMVLLALNELRVPTRLSQGAATAATLARELSLDERALGYLLDAASELGLLRRDGQHYANTLETETFLVAGKPTFLGGGLAYDLDVYPAWGQLPAAIRQGAPQLPADSYLGGDPERTRRFVYGMHSRALATARGIADALDLAGRRHLLDLGGGSGAFSLLLCRRYPTLRSTLLDLPGVVAVAAEIIAADGLTERITLQPGDFHEAQLGAGFDCALLNGILHREPPEFCRELIHRVHDALLPGGLIVLGDVMLDAQGHGPLFPLLFALNMLLTAPGGGAHATSAHVEWLAQAGFAEIRVVPLPAPALHTLVFGTRAGG